MRWIVLAAALVALSGCASGSSIVTGRQRPEISISSVVLYLQPPPVYETVGLVEATSVIGATKQQDMDMAVEELKRRAAKLGANGVLLQNTQSTTGSNSGTFYSSGTGVGFWSGGYANTASVSGIAISVPSIMHGAEKLKGPRLQPCSNLDEGTRACNRPTQGHAEPGTAPKSTTRQPCQPEKMIYAGC